MATATARAFGGLLHDLTDKELLALTDSANRPSLKKYLAMRIAQMWHLVSYDQSLGLIALIHRAIGSGNIGNSHITSERFKLAGTGIRTLNLRVEPYLDNETSEEAAVRLVKAGHTLCNTGDLAAFLYDHPEEVAKWNGWVLAIGEDSRWTNPGGCVYVPCAGVFGANRGFSLNDLRRQLDSDYGVLVSSESGA